MAGMRRALVRDRASAEVVGDVTTAASPDRRGTVVLPGTDRAGGAPGVVRTAVEVVVDGWLFEFEVEDAERAELRARAGREGDRRTQHGPTLVRAIIPGRVVTVAVASGDIVEAGQQLLTVEAMKMQNELRSPRAGTVERVAVGPGATVDRGDVLLVLA